jgi:hypothetical protein
MASELKNKAAEYGAYIPLLDEIIFQGNINSDYISPGIMKNDSNLDIDVKKEQFAYNLNWEPMAGEIVPQEFKKQVRDFFRIFAYTGIISTQLNKTPFSFLEIIPEQIYTPVVDKFVRETAKDLKKGKDSDYLNDFYLRFYVNNPDIFRTGEMGTIPNPSLKFYRNYNLKATPEEVASEYINVVPRTSAEIAGGILMQNEPGLVESAAVVPSTLESNTFEEPKPETYTVDEMTKQNAQNLFDLLSPNTPTDQNIIDKANDLPDDESSCKF